MAALLVLTAAQAVSVAQAQSDEQTGRIVARRLDDGRTEFGWQPAGGARVLPSARYFPAGARVDRWLNSSPVEVNGAEIGRINARLRNDGRIEFGFTPTDGERIAPPSRYFPVDARVGRWLRSTTITIPATATAAGFSAVSAGGFHMCAIRESGAIECWGYNEEGQIDAPAGRFTTVAAGEFHTCAIREDGAIQCWGSNIEREWTAGDATPSEFYTGQANAPAGRFSAVSAGAAHTCAIREDGAIQCWGRNQFGQADAPAGRFSAVSAGTQHNCAIRESGAISCWGRDGEGQADYPTTGRFSAVSAGGDHTCAIREDGAIQCWGNSYYGQATPPAGRFSTVSAGAAHTCGVRDTGAIECWGGNDLGQANAPAGRFSTVAAGNFHTCAIREDGAIQCWGNSEVGQTDAPTP